MNGRFAYYFTYWNDLPADSGYPLFGAVHIAWLLGIAAAIAVCAVCFLRLGEVGRRRFLRALAVIALAMEAYREVVLIATGAWEFQNLPLHLCGMAIFFEALFAFLPCTFLGEMTCAACLPGAAAALLFPDWLRYPTLNYMNLHGFILHGILCLMPILVLISGQYRPRIRRAWMPLVFLAAAAAILYPINARKGSNFMFINYPSLGSPFAAVYAAHGYAAYLVVYVAVVAGVILAMYGVAALIGALSTRVRQRRHPGSP